MCFLAKGYKVLDLDTRKVFVSIDVQFVENIFPFKDIQATPPHLLFPASSQFVDEDPLSMDLSTDNPCTDNS